MHPEIDEKKSVGEDEVRRLQDALQLVENVRNGMEVGANRDAVDFVMAYAQNALNFRDQMSQARERERDTRFELDAVKEELAEVETRISGEVQKLQDTIKEYRTREASHAGMCAAYEKALIAVSQGFATGR